LLSEGKIISILSHNEILYQNETDYLYRNDIMIQYFYWRLLFGGEKGLKKVQDPYKEVKPDEEAISSGLKLSIFGGLEA